MHKLRLVLGITTALVGMSGIAVATAASPTDAKPVPAQAAQKATAPAQMNLSASAAKKKVAEASETEDAKKANAADQQDGSPSPGGGGAAPKPGQVEKIVVQAQRRTQDLQKVPLSVVPVTGEKLNETGSATIESLNRLVPNAVIEHVGLFPTHASLSMRGVGYAGVESFTDPQVAVYVNGVFQPRNATALTSAVDVDAIEVLRGPQGTLYGRNAFAGAISVRTKRPDMDEMQAAAQATLGNYGKQDFDFILNQPLIDGKLAWRVAARQHNFDGFFKNSGIVAGTTAGSTLIDPTLQGKSLGSEETLYVRPTLRFTPADHWDINLFLEYYKDTGGAWVAGNTIAANATSIGAAGFPGYNPYGDARRNLPSAGSDPFIIGNSLDNQDQDVEQYTATLDAAYELKSGTLRGIFNYGRATHENWADTDGENINLFSSVRYETYRTASGELQYVGTLGNSIDVVAGLFYLWDRYNTTQLTYTDTTFPFPAVFTPTTAQNPPTTGPSYINNEGARRAWAAYAQFDWHITQALTLVLGGRYSDEEKYDYRGHNRSLATTPGITATSNFRDHPFTTSTDPNILFVADPTSSQNFAPRVGLNYEVNEDLFLFAFYQEAYKSGGFNAGSADRVGFITPYGDEKVQNYEGGFRSEWWDNRLRLNVNAFYSLYTDLQRSLVTPSASAASGVVTIVTNVADLTSKGVEVSLAAALADSISVYANIGWNDAYYTDFCADLDGATASATPPAGQTVCGPIRTGPTGLNLIPVDNSYLIPMRAPHWDVSFGGSKDFMVGTNIITFDIGANYRSSAYVNLLNVPYSYREPMFIVDSSLTWTNADGNYRLTLWGRNLTDDVQILNYLPVATLFSATQPTEPRTFGITAAARF